MATAKKVRKKPQNNYPPWVKVVAIVFAVILTLLGVEIAPAQEGVLTVTMIDVGQADCFLLEQNGHNMLIDFGESKTADEVIAFLREKGITKLDYAWGTHPHDDHEGGMEEIITSFEVGTVILPKITKMKITTAWYTSLMKELNTKVYNEETQKKEPKYNLIHPQVGDVFTLGEATIEVLGPIEEPKVEKNDYSAILKVSFGEMDIIFTGDAETAVEKDVIASGADLDAEILKLGHHGSHTSTSEDFLDAVSPDYALISAGFDNMHEHPKPVVMERLKERNIEVYRTDESGTVVLTITSNSVEFNTDPDSYLSGVELVERRGKR